MDVRTIAEQQLFTTVRIEAITPDGTATGTAFVFRYDWDSKKTLFLVTNKHVVADATKGRFFFTLKGGDNKPLVGQRFDVTHDNFQGDWHGHPNPDVDIAVMPLIPLLIHVHNAGQQIYYKAVTKDLIPDPEQTKWIDAVEEVTFIGYPNGIYDMKNLLPIVRRGTTATPFQIDYVGEPKFLIDASVFPGSSGSPVFFSRMAKLS